MSLPTCLSVHALSCSCPIRSFTPFSSSLFMEEKTEAQRGEAACPGLSSREQQGQGLKRGRGEKPGGWSWPLCEPSSGNRQTLQGPGWPR